MQNFKVVKQRDGKSLNLNIRAIDVHVNNGNVLGGTFVVTNADNYELISKFKLEQLNGCNGICISRSVMIADNYRGKGLGIHFLNLRESIAIDFGYSAMMCSVVLGNHAQQKIMAKNDWKVLAEFDNKRTSNRVRIYYKKL